MQLTAFLFSAVLLVVLDQWTKWLVTARLEQEQAVPCGPVRIRRVLNRNPDKSFLGRSSSLLGLWLLELMVLAAIVEFGPFFEDWIAAIAIGAALGGAGSNVLDRCVRDGVLDFVDLRVWPVFNLADVAIVAGIAITIFRL
jgi:signal peptidase II